MYAANNDLLLRARQIRTQLAQGKPRNGKPLNILIVGQPGAGKSSLINSLITAIDNEGYKVRARTGFAGVGGVKGASAVTPGLKGYQLFEHSDDAAERRFLCKPVFWDFAGLMDADESSVLESLIKGHNRDGKRLEDMRGIWPSLKTIMFKEARDDRRMHLVMYVQAADQPPAEQLLASLRKVIDPMEQDDRDLTPLVIITKIDKIKAKGSNQQQVLRQIADNVSRHLKAEGEVGTVFKVALYCRDTALDDNKIGRMHNLDEKLCNIWDAILNPYFYGNLK